MPIIINTNEAALLSTITIPLPTYEITDLLNATNAYWKLLPFSDKIVVYNSKSDAYKLLRSAFLFPLAEIKELFQSNFSLFKNDVAIIVHNISGPIPTVEWQKISIFKKTLWSIFPNLGGNSHVFIIPRKFATGYININDPNDFSDSVNIKLNTENHRMGFIASADEINSRKGNNIIIGFAVFLCYNKAVAPYSISINLIGKDNSNKDALVLEAIGPDSTTAGFKIPPKGN